MIPPSSHRLLCWCLITTILGCTDTSSPTVDAAIGAIGVYRIDTTSSNMSVLVGDLLALRAVVYDTNLVQLPGRQVTWQSSSAHATVTSSGVVRGVTSGTVFIRVSSGGYSDSVQIVVLDNVDSLVLIPRTAGIVPGGTTRIIPVLYRDGLPVPDYGRTLQWTSSNPAVASVSGDVVGDVTGLAPGSTTITASGSGTSTTMRVDVDLVSFSGISAGYRTWCGVATGTSRVYCRGVNIYNQMGHPNISESSTPLRVEGIPLATAVAFGSASACALAVDGSAWCWGADHGNLGRGVSPPGDGSLPGPVSGGLTFTGLAVGEVVTCGVATGGGAGYCWGRGSEGALGTGDASDRNVPTPVQGGLSFASISSTKMQVLASYPYVLQYHTCAVTTGGAAYCWGRNTFGQLGDGGITDAVAPVAVAGGRSFATISAGWTYSCGVATDGTGFCWGDNSEFQLGSSGGSSALPRAVSGSLTFTSIATGDRHTCGITTSGAAYCWGRNASGELGDGSQTSSEVPVPVAGGLVFATISTGSMFTCGVTTSNVGYCWGAPLYETGSTVPVKVPGQP